MHQRRVVPEAEDAEDFRRNGTMAFLVVDCRSNLQVRMWQRLVAPFRSRRRA